MFSSHQTIVSAIVLTLLASGCNRGEYEFSDNRVFIAKLAEDGRDVASAQSDVHDALRELFGTADNPRLPAEIAAMQLVSIENLQTASGAFASDKEGNEFGTYRKHCANCHGLSGDGSGPTSGLLMPYPRDFRVGVFKFKSTRIGAKPLRSDLHRTLAHGLPGTSMPSMQLYDDDYINVLVDYVIFLSIRGETERSLYRLAANEFDYGDEDLAGEDRIFAKDLESEDPDTYAIQLAEITDIAVASAERWQRAEEAVVEVPDAPAYVMTAVKASKESGSTAERYQQSIERGEELFAGTIANCAVCHGAKGQGDGQTTDYDDWTKEWTMRVGIDPKDPANRAKIKQFVRLGAQKPKTILPRDFSSGSFKAGSEPQDIYRRIVQGIDGTPMPAINLVQEESKSGLTSNQVWDVVNYVLSLSEQGGE